MHFRTIVLTTLAAALPFTAPAQTRTKRRTPARPASAPGAQASRKALDVIKSAPTNDPGGQGINAGNKIAALSTYALAMRLVATKVDQTQASAAWEAYQGYIAVETDAAKKAKLRGDALQMIFGSGSIDLAIAEARKVLATEPNEVDANRVLGLALFASGEKKNFQEAADHLQRYVDLAARHRPAQAVAKESLDYLKTAENIEPRKGQATRAGFSSAVRVTDEG